ncbi:uncharacterized protein LOC144905414 [Branchiostoma floridae x Branchiostoma belcheri]
MADNTGTKVQQSSGWVIHVIVPWPTRTNLRRLRAHLRRLRAHLRRLRVYLRHLCKELPRLRTTTCVVSAKSFLTPAQKELPRLRTNTCVVPAKSFLTPAQKEIPRRPRCAQRKLAARKNTCHPCPVEEWTVPYYRTTSSSIDPRWCLRFCMMSLLSDDLNSFAQGWNDRRKLPGHGAPAGRPNVLYFLPHLSGGLNLLQHIPARTLDQAQQECRPPSVVGNDRFEQYAWDMMGRLNKDHPRNCDEAFTLYRELIAIAT